MERKVFTRLSGEVARTINDALTHAGFRRSQNIAYKPSCESCQACISVRIVVDAFEASRSLARVAERNRGLVGEVVDPGHEEQFTLLRRYLDAAIRAAACPKCRCSTMSRWSRIRRRNTVLSSTAAKLAKVRANSSPSR